MIYINRTLDKLDIVRKKIIQTGMSIGIVKENVVRGALLKATFT